MITDHGMTVPIGSDDFDPEGAISALATSLQPMVIVPVASQAAADTLATSHTPSSTDPLYVYRADLDEILYTTDGTNWRVPGTGPALRLTRASAQSIPAGEFTPIAWDTEVEDTNGMWTSATPNRITVQRSGLYLLTGGIGVAGATSGQFVIALLIGGTVNVHSPRLPAGDSVLTPISWQHRFTAGQWFEVQFFQNSGATRNTPTVTEGRPHFQMTWQRP